MEYILISILLTAVFAFVAYPILYPRHTGANVVNALDALSAQRDSAYEAIRDIDFDYQLGKLSPTDYAALRERYIANAAATLQQIDAMTADQTRASEPELVCHNCGSPHEAEDKFCRKCGNKLG